MPQRWIGLLRIADTRIWNPRDSEWLIQRIPLANLRNFHFVSWGHEMFWITGNCMFHSLTWNYRNCCCWKQLILPIAIIPFNVHMLNAEGNEILSSLSQSERRPSSNIWSICDAFCKRYHIFLSDVSKFQEFIGSKTVEYIRLELVCLQKCIDSSEYYFVLIKSIMNWDLIGS